MVPRILLIASVGDQRAAGPVPFFVVLVIVRPVGRRAVVRAGRVARIGPVPVRVIRITFVGPASGVIGGCDLMRLVVIECTIPIDR